MICVICKTGHYKEGTTTVVLTKGETTVVIIKGVPAMVCDQCGEYVLTSEVTRKVLAMAKEAQDKGTEVEIRRFAA